METKHKITAISGWAIPRTWYAEQIQKAFPYSNIQVIYPENPEDEEEAKYLLNQYQSQLYIGYSLGSLWLLKHHIYLPQNCDKAILAPILAFLNTSNLGGKTSEGQLKYLIKILNDSSSKKEVLKDFFFHADLPYPETQIDDIPDRNTLIKGLEFLKNNSVTGKETKDFLSIIGENDNFINAESLKKYIPQLKIIEDAGHSPTKLLMHLAKILNNK